MNWERHADGSWNATDTLGYRFRVQKVLLIPDGETWVCSWSETGNWRVSNYGHPTLAAAKAAMENIAAIEAA